MIGSYKLYQALEKCIYSCDCKIKLIFPYHSLGLITNLIKGLTLHLPPGW